MFTCNAANRRRGQTFSLQLKWFFSVSRGAAAPARSCETDGIKEARLNQPQSALMGGGGGCQGRLG